MAGESILIIDDTPVNLKLTQILLGCEGYAVRTACDAEEALALLEHYRPELILADIQLPGMSGLEFTRRLKADEKTRAIVIVALTALAMKGDEEKAMDAGCDGYITKPIDTRAFPLLLRAYLARGSQALPAEAESAAPPSPDKPFSFDQPEFEPLRSRFLAETTPQCERLIQSLDGVFDAVEAGKLVHKWIGAAGLLGYAQVSRLSREAEQSLAELPVDGAQVRECLTRVLYALWDARPAAATWMPGTAGGKLAGKRCGLIGFPEMEAERLSAALLRAHAAPCLFNADSEPSEVARGCDIVLVRVGVETFGTAWLMPRSAGAKPPLMLVGDRESLFGLAPPIHYRAEELVFSPWQTEEALIRAGMVLSRLTDATTESRPRAGVPVRLHPDLDLFPAATALFAGPAECGAVTESAL